jgi:chaperone modulatory protein CbpM
MRLMLSEAARITGIATENIERFIAFAWIRPAEEDGPLLDEADLARCQLIHDLQEHFGVNNEAVPLILDLLDQLYTLQGEFAARMPKAR